MKDLHTHIGRELLIFKQTNKIYPQKTDREKKGFVLSSQRLMENQNQELLSKL
jgi:hypothetical protein